MNIQFNVMVGMYYTTLLLL